MPHLSTRQQRGAILKRLAGGNRVRPDETDQRCDGLAPAGEQLDGGQIVGDELVFAKQVARRIADHAQFGKDHQLAPSAAARSIRRAIAAALPAMSPTMGLN